MNEAVLAREGEAEQTSLSRQEWRLRECDEARLIDIKRRFSLSDCVARLLVGRSVSDEEIERFLSPTLKHFLPEPYIFADMEKAVRRTAQAVHDGETIILYGDYDVDGATSVALLHGFLTAIGHGDLRFYIPERLSEGYGVNEAAVEKLSGEGSLMITMDCGTSSLAALRKARDLGLDVIVLDHHKPQADLPPAFALVNPNSPSAEQSEAVSRDYGHLAAVGVSFVFLVALNRHLREAGFYKTRDEPDLLQSLDLVALGTVCDVVALRGLNRAFVYGGLRRMSQGEKRPGLRALVSVAKLAEAEISSEDLGFRLGPRLNAGSRLGESSMAARLLVSADSDEASALAWRLDSLNAERQEMQARQLSEALQQAEVRMAEGGAERGYILVSDVSWHVGLLGILAGRLKEHYKCPAIVISFVDGIGKGSGRSISGVDLGSVIIEAQGLGLLASGGGHAQAVGLSLSEGGLLAFDEFLASRLGGVVRRSILDVDLSLSLSAVNADLCRELDLLAPYGSGHEVPRVLFSRVRVMDLRILRERHISCRLCDVSGSVRGILFNGVEHVLGSVLLSAGVGDEFDIVGRISPPYGDNVRGSVIIEDIAQVSHR